MLTLARGLTHDMTDYDTDKVDDAVLALLHLTIHDHVRTWKGHDWSAMDRLHQKGFISDPRTKNKSVVMTKEGSLRSEKLFCELFGKRTGLGTGTRRYFRSVGDTVNQAKLLYDHPDGVTNVETARILQIRPKNSRRNFERLIKQGLAVRMGKLYALNARGRREWENSPFFRNRPTDEPAGADNR
jgi:hypothetical protein